MNRVIIVFCSFVFVPHVLLAATDVRIQILDAQIEQLERERATKLDELQQCEKQTKGFKIAGLSTLALTGIGIYANVKLSEKLKKAGSGAPGGALGGDMVDARSQNDKDCSGAKELFDLGLATQEEVDETCNK